MHFLLPAAAALLLHASAPASLAQSSTQRPQPATEPPVAAASRVDEPMVDVAKAYPKIFIELRYATSNNVTGQPIYPKRARCYLRKSVADRLEHARLFLLDYGAGLKIWDAYRPAWAQEILWNAVQNREYVGDPARGGSFHTWGAAVDVTLTDRHGRELQMPSDFDTFTAAAKTLYTGDDPKIRNHVRLLQTAMHRAGFRMLYDEWWHFVARDFRAFAPTDIPLVPEKD
jgi:D-alanyl-D-alanine dipeptidase